MTITELYNYLMETYGKRKAWISDIATALNISMKEARFLTQAIGYHNGKATSIVPLAAFSTDKDVILIHSKL